MATDKFGKRLTEEEELLRKYWNDAKQHIKRDIAYVWSDEVRGDFNKLKVESKRIAFILKRFHSYYRSTPTTYRKEVTDIRNLIHHLNKIEAKVEWVREIDEDLKIIIFDVERDKYSGKEYKIPDLNKIKLLTSETIDGWGSTITQTLIPKIGFGRHLPIKDGDKIVYHCLNAGDVFISLAVDYDIHWIASDIRPVSVEHTKEKLNNAEIRLNYIAKNIYDDVFRKTNSTDKAEEAKSRAIADLRAKLIQELSILRKRRIEYLAGDSNYLGIPTKSVDWCFSYEPVLFGQLTALIEMLSSSRNGVILSFSQLNNKDILKEPEDSEFTYFYNVINGYGLKIKIRHEMVDTFDHGEQEVSFAIIDSNSVLPIIDRNLIGYCSEFVFPKQKLLGLSTVRYEVINLSKGPFKIDVKHAGNTLRISELDILKSLARLHQYMEYKYCDTKYSFVQI